jgi:hypothetical protein
MRQAALPLQATPLSPSSRPYGRTKADSPRIRTAPGAATDDRAQTIPDIHRIVSHGDSRMAKTTGGHAPENLDIHDRSSFTRYRTPRRPAVACAVWPGAGGKYSIDTPQPGGCQMRVDGVSWRWPQRRSCSGLAGDSESGRSADNRRANTRWSSARPISGTTADHVLFPRKATDAAVATSVAMSSHAEYHRTA